MTTKNEILEYLDNVLHPLVSPEHWNVYSELHDMVEDLPDLVKNEPWGIKISDSWCKEILRDWAIDEEDGGRP